MNRPWMQLFVGDWLKHPGLRSCSAQARALAIDLLCLMHQGDPYGHLRVGRKDLGAREIARIVGEPEEEVDVRLTELLEAGVFALTTEGRIYSARMVRDEVNRVRSKEHGAMGGNPELKPHAKPSPKPPPNPADNPSHARARSEVRGQKSETLAASGRVKKGENVGATVEHAEAVRRWNKAFEQETGQAYPFDGAVDGKQIQRLLKFPDFTFEELERRAWAMLQSPFWAQQGVDLKKFASQWAALGNAGRKVDPASNGRDAPSDEELAWCRRAIVDPSPVAQEEARKRLRRWRLAESDLLGGAK